MEPSRHVWVMILMVQPKEIDYCYVCPKILAILEEEINFLVGSACHNNREGLPGKYSRLNIPRVCERVTFTFLYNHHFFIISTQWKDSKTL